jgi:eukaryotic-like serine/threonine-protein kinase
MLTLFAVIGETVGGYRIVARLGQGGTGEVFAAEHASVGSKAAIKIIAPALAADPARVQTYLKAAQKASRINNQGTVKVSEVGPTFVVMELVQGESLAARIAKSGRFSITQIAEVARQLATVVAALHDENLVHGDLRPDKIFFVKEGGLAQERIKLLVGDALLLGPTHERGAPYAAPEVWRGTADWRADIYALGCIIFEMATGSRPYSGGDLAQKHAEYQIPAARSLMPDVPPALDGLIARLMAKHVEQRPKSMRELARELDALGGTTKALAPTFQEGAAYVGEMNAATLPGGSRPPPPAARPTPIVPVPEVKKSKLPLVLGLALVLAGIIVVLVAVL